MVIFLTAAMDLDAVILKGLIFSIVVGRDAWRRTGKAQPVHISIEISPVNTFEAAAAQDDISLTVDYGKLYKTVDQFISGQSFESVDHLLATVIHCMPPYKMLHVEITLPKALLLVDGGVIYSAKITQDDNNQFHLFRKVRLNQIHCSCIIGVNPHERLYRQRLLVGIGTGHVSSELPSVVDYMNTPGSDYFDCVKEVVERVEASSYQTVEALATAVAQIVTMNYGLESATIRVEKPSAIATIEIAAVQLTRTRAFFENKDFWKVKLP